MDYKIPKNNAFGVGSPSWNLPFPIGNVTVAEIAAYIPHAFKSIDVIDRVVTNGATSIIITAMLHKYRVLTKLFKPNSMTIMMKNAMRGAGFKGWTVSKHGEYERPDPSYPANSLDVTEFRCPRETHPKTPSSGDSASLKHNSEAPPIEFKSLALDVQQHPSGPDALDLTRCVAYALAHPNEHWLFPDDFGTLVNKLGGPTPVTHLHLDGAAFTRVKGTHGPASTNTVVAQAASGRKRARSESTESELSTHNPQTLTTRPIDQNIVAMSTPTGGVRKSGRLASKPAVNLRERENDTDATVSASLFASLAAH